VSKLAESQIAEAQKKFVSVVDNAVKNAPAGTENAVVLVKSAVAAANNAFDTMQKAVKQAADVAEANFQAMTNGTTAETRDWRRWNHPRWWCFVLGILVVQFALLALLSARGPLTSPPPPQKATAETASHPKRSKNLSKYSAQGGVPVAEDGGRSNFRKRSKSIINEWTPASNEAGVC